MTDRRERDRALWARFRAGAVTTHGEPLRGPDDAVLAAWLDGALNETEAGPVERWLADDPDALAFVAATRSDTEGAKVTPPSKRAIRRAQALVPAPATGANARVPGLFGRLFSPVAGAALAAMLVAAFGGFELGAATFTGIDAVDDQVAAEIWPADNIALDEDAG